MSLLAPEDGGPMLRGLADMAEGKVQSLAEIDAEVGWTRADGWQPIETAPKDGTRILVFTGPHPLVKGGQSRVSIAHWGFVYDSEDGWVRDNIGTFEEPVLFWQPLPTPPARREDET